LSASALASAIRLASGEKPVLILLHVIDPSLVKFATDHGWGSQDEVIAIMRQRAEQELEDYRQLAKDGMEIDVVVSEGVPFLEILRKSDDFAVDAIVIGKIGSRGAIDKLLFGSTAEKVLRGSRRPVIVIPSQ
jgi:nucleotide-binding universal stress UspA family protein